jgi:hypothetical protein
MKSIRSNALNAARTDALAKVGIEIRGSDARLQSESNQAFVDFYSKFAETSSKGIILIDIESFQEGFQVGNQATQLRILPKYPCICECNPWLPLLRRSSRFFSGSPTSIDRDGDTFRQTR